MATTPPSTPARTGQPSRADRAALVVVAVLAAVGSLTAAVTYAVTHAGALAAGETRLELLTRVEVPHAGTPGIGDAPGIVSAGFESAWVVATGLSDTVRLLQGIGMAVTALTIAIVGCAIAWLLVTVAAGKPFHRSLRAASLIAGFTLTLGPVVTTGLTGLAQMQAADELNHLANDIFVSGFSIPVTALGLPLAGLAILALSYVFHVGERLQRDTEGLV